MNRLAYLSLLLAACTGGERADSGQCPAGEVCSPATPRGLHFLGDITTDSVLGSLTAPAATAIGGTQQIALEYDRGDGTLIALDLPFTADADAADGVKIDSTSGSVVTVRGVGSRVNYLRIVDPATNELYDRKQLAGAALDTMVLYGTDLGGLPPKTQLAFAAGEETVGVALYGQVQEGNAVVTDRLVDHSMVISGAGGTQMAWDAVHFANATVGTFTLAVTAGDKPTADLQLAVVDHADVLTELTNPVRLPAGGGQFCFVATTGQLLTISGLAWSYTVDGAPAAPSEPAHNCVNVSTPKTTGTVAIIVNAGGKSETVTVPIGTSAARFAPFGFVGRGTSLGDRAQM